MIGVVVPVCGWAPYLAEALDSVLACSPDAVAVVDDGSPEPLALHPEHAARCELVRRETRGGPAAARAAGAAALAPELDWIALCDADDAWEPGKLAGQRAALAEHPEAAVCFGRARVVGPDDRPTGERWPEPAAGLHEGRAFAGELFTANPVPTSSALVRRAALEAAGGFASPVEVAEDWELWLRLARSGAAFVCAPDAVVRYRRRADALTADVARLARAQRAVHEAHGDLVAPAARAAALAADDAALAAGLARDGRYADARALLPRGRRRKLLSVPGVRGLSGRRDPYRG